MGLAFRTSATSRAAAALMSAAVFATMTSICERESDLIGNHVGSAILALHQLVGLFAESSGEPFGLWIESQPRPERGRGLLEIDAVGDQVILHALECFAGQLIAFDHLGHL